MKIVTSYYGHLKTIKEEHPDWFLVSSSGWIPDDILNSIDIQDKGLAPSKDIYYEYETKKDWEHYVKRFKAERLPKVDWLEKLEKWEETANKIGKKTETIVILCYEGVESEDNKGHFCHRHILAESIEKEFNTSVDEYGFPNYIRENYRMIPEFNTDFLF